MSRELKIILSLAIIFAIFFILGEINGFKLFKDETGVKWNKSEIRSGSANHK